MKLRCLFGHQYSEPVYSEFSFTLKCTRCSHARVVLLPFKVVLLRALLKPAAILGLATCLLVAKRRDLALALLRKYESEEVKRV